MGRFLLFWLINSLLVEAVFLGIWRVMADGPICHFTPRPHVPDWTEWGEVEIDIPHEETLLTKTKRCTLCHRFVTITDTQEGWRWH